MKRGIFLLFEGIEGCGKSTQAQMLVDALAEKGLEVDLTREPGGTEVAEKIRQILLDPELEEMHPKTELFLYLAARAEHVSKRIRRNLHTGKQVVVCDRFTLSTLAYQAGGRELNIKDVARLCKFATGGLEPDMTILVDLDVEVAFSRLDRPHDRVEKAGFDFHQRVRQAYLEFARRSPGKIRVFDGAKEKEMLHQEIKEIVFEFLASKGVM